MLSLVDVGVSRWSAGYDVGSQSLFPGLSQLVAVKEVSLSLPCAGHTPPMAHFVVCMSGTWLALRCWHTHGSHTPHRMNMAPMLRAVVLQAASSRFATFNGDSLGGTQNSFNEFKFLSNCFERESLEAVVRKGF